MSNLKEELYKEIELRNNTGVEGVRFDPQIFKSALEKDANIAVAHNCMDFSIDDTADIEVPGGFRFEHGIGASLNKNSRSPYYLEEENGDIILKKDGERLSKIEVTKASPIYGKKTSDGTSMKTIVAAGDGQFGDKQILVAYSNECALKDKGLDCLFCNINATKDRFAEKENIEWKNPKQIAETVKTAYDLGYNHLTITGGFIPERREVEYYLDTAETIREYLGTDTFNGTACIGAPQDLAVLEKYKEAGFSTIGINLEVWNKDFFRAICPGKAELCGGYDNWLKAIDYAIQVFGVGNVRSNFVPGLEPKEYLLEGIETLAEKGVVATAAFNWVPNIGSKFEGHRTPTPEWHWDVQQRIYRILRKYGRTYEQVYNATPGALLLHDFYKVDDELLPVFHQ
ncbi:radical SAM protein [Anaerosporobacter sp.]|uniref:radical SAM protein n=1 Tax=Anaerosporobacter sp. TaxID=1872529 RepID=UPI00286F657C|nr:radical SAM protein [Anaerosporobacter sp.]